MTSKFPNGSECAGIFSDRIPVVLAPEKTLWKRLLIARKSHKETADPTADPTAGLCKLQNLGGDQDDQ